MITNARIKFIRSLSEKKFRERSGLFVVEGEKLVNEALASDYEVEEVFRADEIGEEAMKRISLLASPSPSLALVRMKSAAAEIRPDFDSLSLALDSVRDPGNMGTILRIADWFGINDVYLSPDCTDIYSPKVVQATMGALFRVNALTCDIVSLCRSYKKASSPVWGTLLDGENIYGKDLSPSGLVVMGNESAGISGEVRAMVDGKLLIPSFREGMESLNVAVATGIVLSEFRRR